LSEYLPLLINIYIGFFWLNPIKKGGFDIQPLQKLRQIENMEQRHPVVSHEDFFDNCLIFGIYFSIIPN